MDPAAFTNQIVTGDNLDVMAQMPAGLARLAVTSPPYPGQYGLDMSVSEWFGWLGVRLVHVHRLLADDGVLALNAMIKRTDEGWFDIRLFDLPSLLHSVGFNMLDTYMYVKKNPVPNGPLTYCDIPAWEPVFVATKAQTVDATPFQAYRKPYRPKSLAGDGKVYTSRAKDGGITVRPHSEGARQTNVLALSSSGDQNRPKAKGVSFPLELPERFILQHTQPGDLVLDPFAGVGTTCKAAAIHGRLYTGIEVNPDEAELARKWLAEAWPPPSKPKKKQAVASPQIALPLGVQ